MIIYLLLLLLIMVYKAAPFMLNVKVNWFFLKINIIVMRKLGVFSCDELDSERNKKLGKVSLFVQKFGKLKIYERLNSNHRNSNRQPESNQVLLRSCLNRF